MSEVNHADVMSRAEKMVEKFGVAQRGGKKYLEVKHRVALCRENYALDYGIETSIVDAECLFGFRFYFPSRKEESAGEGNGERRHDAGQAILS